MNKRRPYKHTERFLKTLTFWKLYPQNWHVFCNRAKNQDFGTFFA